MKWKKAAAILMVMAMTAGLAACEASHPQTAVRAREERTAPGNM